MSNEIIIQLASKIGINANIQLIDKSSELLRRLESLQSIAKCSANAKIIICIDVASNILNSQLDGKEALKVSGLGKKDYLRLKRTIEKLLDVSQIVDISKICIQLGIMLQVQKVAERYLNEYKSIVASSSYQEIDFSHPQYAAMALYQAAKNEKVKVSKSKLIEYSFLKSLQWEKLEKSWNKVMVNREKAPEQNQEKDIIETPTFNAKTEVKEIKIEQQSYETWRDEILLKSYNDLVESKKLDDIDIALFSFTHELNITVQNTAKDLLKSYRKKLVDMNQDENIFDHKYTALAIFNAFNQLNKEAPLKKIIEFSQLSMQMWNNLVEKWNRKSLCKNDDNILILDYEDFTTWKGRYKTK